MNITRHVMILVIAAVLTACSGSEDFGVDVGEATEIMVMLNCKRPRRLGAVRVNGKFNICSQLQKAVASPLQTSIGNDIDLSAIAEDPEGDSITYTRNGGTCGAGMTVASGGTISGTLVAGDIPSCTVIVRASATGGNDDAASVGKRRNDRR